MKELWEIFKKFIAWIIGLFGILFGIFILFTGVFILSKIFAGLLIIIGLYIIPLINKYVKIGLRPIYISILFSGCLIGIPISETREKHNENIETEIYVITANNLNVRAGESTDDSVIFKLVKGDKINVIAKDDEWTKIELDNGQIGFVSSKFISANNIRDKSENNDKKGKYNWLTYFMIGGVIVVLLFSKDDNAKSKKSISENNKISSIQFKNYQCIKCGRLVQNTKKPSAFDCSEGGHHSWFDLGEVGDTNYECVRCRLLLKSKKTPSVFDCTEGGRHNWSKL